MEEVQDPPVRPSSSGESFLYGLMALAMVAAHYRVSADPAQLAHELGLGQRATDGDDIVRAAKRIGLRARRLRGVKLTRLAAAPLPAIVVFKDGQLGFAGPTVGCVSVFRGTNPSAT